MCLGWLPPFLLVDSGVDERKTSSETPWEEKSGGQEIDFHDADPDPGHLKLTKVDRGENWSENEGNPRLEQVLGILCGTGL